MAAATFRYLVQLHKDVPKAARFYSEGLGFTIDVCSLRWAELHSGPLKLALLHSPRSKRNLNIFELESSGDVIGEPVVRCIRLMNAVVAVVQIINTNCPIFRQRPFRFSDHVEQKGYSSLLSFTVTDISSTVTKLMALGAELDGPIKHEIHGKVAAMRCADGHVLGLYEPA